MQRIHTIAIFPKIQPDTVCAIFLLQRFGEAQFPGVREAKVEFWTDLPAGKSAAELERDGYLLIDLGGGRFDHHATEHGKNKVHCASSLVAAALGVSDKPALAKLLAYAKRDDLHGKGTISSDPLDRAFGLSGLLSAMNRVSGDKPQRMVDIVLELFDAHYREEEKRTESMPQEWRELKNSGNAHEFVALQARQALRCVLVASDNVSLPGFLRAYVRTDIVVQRRSSGHANIITRQARRIDLRDVAARLRMEEAARKGVDLAALPWSELQKPGRIDGAEEWFYDIMANTIQNGGIRPEGITPTRLSDAEIRKILEEELPRGGETLLSAES